MWQRDKSSSSQWGNRKSYARVCLDWWVACMAGLCFVKTPGLYLQVRHTTAVEPFFPLGFESHVNACTYRSAGDGGQRPTAHPKWVHITTPWGFEQPVDRSAEVKTQTPQAPSSATFPSCTAAVAGIRADCHRTHQVAQSRIAESGNNGRKWRVMGGNRGKGGGGGGDSGNSTRDVGGGLWWTKMGEKWDEIPTFHSPISPIFLEVDGVPHNSLCENQLTALTDGKMDIFATHRHSPATAASADAYGQRIILAPLHRGRIEGA